VFKFENVESEFGEAKSGEAKLGESGKTAVSVLFGGF
jgi:hypothetical protein